MAILQVPKIPKHSYTLIAVPDERIDSQVSDYTEIESEGQKYKIVQRVTIHRNERMPSTLTLLSTGKDLSYEEIWNVFKKSEKIIFFICDRL